MGRKDIKTTLRYLHQRVEVADADRIDEALVGTIDVEALLAKPVHEPHQGAKGERNARSKLTEADVETILRRLHAGETQYALAKEYGVASGTLNYVANGKTWPAGNARVTAELAAQPLDRSGR